MTDQVARGEIEIVVDDKSAIAALENVDRKFERTMRDIEREKAEVSLSADVDQLKRDLAEGKQAVRDYNARIKDADSKQSAAQLKRYKDEKEALLENKKEALAAAKERLRAHKAENAELKQADKDEDARFKHKMARFKEEEKAQARKTKQIAAADKAAAAAEKREDARIKKEVRQRNQIGRMVEQAAVSEERARDRVAKSDQEATAARLRATTQIIHNTERLRTLEEKGRVMRQRELDSIPRMQSRYIALTQKLEDLERSRRRAGKGSQEEVKIVLKKREAEAELARLDAFLKRHKAEVEVPVRFERSNRLGAYLRAQVGNNRSLLAASAAVGVDLGAKMGDGINRGVLRKAKPASWLPTVGAAVGRGAANAFGWLGRAADNISNMTVRLGPFTATIRQFMLIMTLLGPTIVDLGASLVALGGSFASAAGGLGALASAFVAGAIPAALGFGLVIKQVGADFKNAQTAQKNYDKAVLEHGKNSDQAAKKLEILRNVLGGVDARTAKSIGTAHKLGDAWREVTKPARATAFHAIGDGLNFARENMALFGRNTNAVTSIFGRFAENVIGGLRSLEGQTGLRTVMRNFNSFLEPALNGIQNLLAAFGRFAAVASEFLPGIGRGFEAWSEGVEKSSQNTDKLRTNVGNMVASFRQWMGTLGALGRLLVTVLGGGREAGDGLAKSLENTFNRWNDFLRTTTGQNSMHDFFQRAADGARALFGLIGPLVGTFVRWSSALSPVVTGFTQMLTLISNVVVKLSEFAVVRSWLTALGATLAAMWAVGKISSFTGAIATLTRAFLGLRTAATGAAAAQAAASTIGGGKGGAMLAGATASGNVTRATAGFLRQRAAIAASAGAMAAGASSAGKFGSAMIAARVATVAFVSPLGLAVGSVGALAIGLSYAGSKGSDFQQKLQGLATDMRNAKKVMDDQGNAARALRPALAQVGAQYQQSRLSLSQAKDALANTKKGTDEHRQALLQYRQALADSTRSGEQFRQMEDQMVGAANKAAEAARRRFDAWREGDGEKNLEAERRNLEALKRSGASTEEIAAAQSRYNLALAQRNGLQRDLEGATNRQAAAALNAARAYRGMVELTGQAEQNVGKLARSQPNLAKKISLKFEAPKDAGRVAASANRAIQSGIKSKRAVDIVANSKTAEQAIRRLNRIRITSKTVRIVEKGGQEAVNVIERIVGRKLPTKLQKIIEHGGPEALAALQAIAGKDLPPKTQHTKETGGRGVLSILATIAGFPIPRALKHITDGGTGHGVLSTLARIASQTNLGRAFKDIYERVHHARATGGHVSNTRGFATGGLPAEQARTAAASTRLEKIMERAEKEAAQGNRYRRRRGRVSRPTFMVGEENKPEVVIAGNPAYRKQNIAYWKDAGRMLGVPGFAAGGSFVSSGAYQPGVSNNPGYNPDLDPPKPTSRPPGGPRALSGKGGKRKKAWKKGRGKASVTGDLWRGYLDDLTFRQDSLEREVSIRESEVREPEDLMVESGRIMVDDPNNPGKKIDAGPNMIANQPAINAYVTAMNYVLEAMKALRAVIFEIMMALPQAQKAFNTERGYRQMNVSELEGQIKRDERITGSSKKSNHAKAVAQARIDKNQKRLDAENEIISDIDAFNDDYRERRADAGFDLREADIRISQATADRDGMQGRGDRAAAEANTSTSSTGAGGGTSGTDPAATPQVYGPMILDNERGRLFQQYAGNTNAVAALGTAVGGAAAGALGQGVTNALVGGAGGGGMAAVSGAAAGAISSGAAAGAALAPAGVGAVANTGGAGTIAAPAAGSGDTIVNQTNNFLTQPKDPLTFARSTAYELEAAL